MEISFQVTDMAHVIQLAVAPVFLIVGLGTILSVLMVRLARIVDRARQLEDRFHLVDHKHHSAMDYEIRILCRRARLANWSISLCTLCALLICMIIVVLFVGTFLGLDIAIPVAVLFIASMVALIVALVLFLKEIYLGTSSLRIGGHTSQWPESSQPDKD